MNVMTRQPMSELNGRELVITRDFNAPRKQVFAAWTEARLASRWWVPRDFTSLSCEMDVRPGGIWHRRMRAPDGAVFIKHGVYREIVTPERLVFTYITEDGAGIVDPETLVTVTFADLGGQTRLYAPPYRVRDRGGTGQSPGRLDRLPGAIRKLHREGLKEPWVPEPCPKPVSPACAKCSQGTLRMATCPASWPW